MILRAMRRVYEDADLRAITFSIDVLRSGFDSRLHHRFSASLALLSIRFIRRSGLFILLVRHRAHSSFNGIMTRKKNVFSAISFTGEARAGTRRLLGLEL